MKLGKSTKMHGSTTKSATKNKGRSSTGKGVKKPELK